MYARDDVIPETTACVLLRPGDTGLAILEVSADDDVAMEKISKADK